MILDMHSTAHQNAPESEHIQRILPKQKPKPNTRQIQPTLTQNLSPRRALSRDPSKPQTSGPKVAFNRIQAVDFTYPMNFINDVEFINMGFMILEDLIMVSAMGPPGYNINNK